MNDQSRSELTSAESLRYARHLILPEVGRAGQERLKSSRVLIIGAGGLGSPSAMYLAAAGVGTIGLADFDVVDASNLQRQILHGTADLGRPKLDSARDRLADINPGVAIELHPARLTSENALDILRPYDLVVDGSDNFPTRYLLNDACVLLGKPYVYGAVFRFDGQNSVFDASRGPCYRCLFPEPPPPGMVPSCAEAGVLGVLPGIIGTIQAAEALKLLLQAGDSLVGRLLLFDALRMTFREMKLRKDPKCPMCGENPTIHELMDYEHFCATAPGAGGADGTDARPEIPEISATELKQRLDRGDRLTVVDVREPHEWDIGNLHEYGAKHVPLGDLPERLDEIDASAEIVLHCRSGGRSGKALEFLRGQGYTNLWNLKGGILAWSDEVDPSMPKY
jgi:adenylyltransferase/sulfurtransferase